MKKIFIIVAMALAGTTTQAAENVNNVDTFDMSTNINSLSKYLNLSNEQLQGVSNTHETFCAEVKEIGTTNDKRDEKIDIAIKRNIKYMKMYLEKDQYKKYLRVLNATLVNKKLVR